MQLCYIVAGINKPHKWVKPIKRYIPIKEENKKYFFADTVLIEELNNEIHAVKYSDLCFADIDKNTGRLGDNFRISNDYIII